MKFCLPILLTFLITPARADVAYTTGPWYDGHAVCRDGYVARTTMTKSAEEICKGRSSSSYVVLECRAYFTGAQGERSLKWVSVVLANAKSYEPVVTVGHLAEFVSHSDRPGGTEELLESGPMLLTEQGYFEGFPKTVRDIRVTFETHMRGASIEPGTHVNYADTYGPQRVTVSGPCREK